jgi:hypothetical protein
LAKKKSDFVFEPRVVSAEDKCVLL